MPKYERMDFCRWNEKLASCLWSGNGEKQESSILQIEYIGKKPIPKQIGYRIETPSGSSTEIGLLNNQGILMITDVCGECTNVNEETGINMAVEWGRQIELFTLQFEKIEEWYVWMK